MLLVQEPSAEESAETAINVRAQLRDTQLTLMAQLPVQVGEQQVVAVEPAALAVDITGRQDAHHLAHLSLQMAELV